MPVLGNALDFAKYEGRNFRGHQLGTAPATPVTGQLYYNTADNTLYWWDGTAWVSARGGAAATPPATTIALGTIQLAGDLAGTATSPQIAAGAVTDVEVAAANKDGVAGTASMRTIGGGAQQAMAGSTRLNAIPSPDGPVSANSQKITNLATPTVATDAATMGYVDAVAQGLAPKESVKIATTTNITLSGQQTIDGISILSQDRVLVKDQSAPAQNGIYICSVGAWLRANDADAWAELPSAFTFVEQGTVNADTGWVCTSDQGGTLNTTAVTWARFSGAGQITAGAGLTKTGDTLSVGAGSGLQVNADDVQIAGSGITNTMMGVSSVDLAGLAPFNALPVAKGGTNATNAPAALVSLGAAGYYSSATHGAGTTITITQATHGLRASRGLMVQVKLESDGSVLIPDIAVAANGDVTVTFGVSQSANTIRVTVIG